jgi:hypothetical protein
VFFVNRAHQSGRWWKHLIDENEDGFLGGQLDAFANDIDELSDGEVRWDQILLLVDRRNVGFLYLFADDGDTVGVLLALRWSVSLRATHHGMRELTMRSASALRFSKGCSSLNLDRILMDVDSLLRVKCCVLCLLVELCGSCEDDGLEVVEGWSGGLCTCSPPLLGRQAADSPLA